MADNQHRASAIVPSSSALPYSSQSIDLPAMTTMAQREAQAQQRHQGQRAHIHMWAEALLDVAWNRSQQSAHFLTPTARPWEIHTVPDGRLFKQVIVAVIEDFGQICDCIPSLAAK